MAGEAGVQEVQGKHIPDLDKLERLARGLRVALGGKAGDTFERSKTLDTGVTVSFRDKSPLARPGSLGFTASVESAETGKAKFVFRRDVSALGTEFREYEVIGGSDFEGERTPTQVFMDACEVIIAHRTPEPIAEDGQARTAPIWDYLLH